MYYFHTYTLLYWAYYEIQIYLKNLNFNSINVNKNPTDATVCRYLFTAKLLYMFRVSQHPSSGVLKTVPAASGTGHTTCTATPLLRGLICILLHLLDFYSHWITMHQTTSLKFNSILSSFSTVLLRNLIYYVFVFPYMGPCFSILWWYWFQMYSINCNVALFWN